MVENVRGGGGQVVVGCVNKQERERERESKKGLVVYQVVGERKGETREGEVWKSNGFTIN